MPNASGLYHDARAESNPQTDCAARVNWLASGTTLVSRLLMALSIPVALAQSAAPATPADERFLEQLALAKARRALFEQVQTMPLWEDESVGAWLNRDVGLARAARLWLRSLPKTGAVRVYSDGSADVDLRLTADALRAKLSELASRFADRLGEATGAPAASRASRGWPTLWVTGTSSLAERDETRKTPGWEDVAIEGLQVARLAAAADAVHALLEEAGALKVTAARRLQDFLDSDAAVRAAVAEQVRAAAHVALSAELDQVVVAEARLPLADLIRILSDTHARLYTGGLFHAADFREMALNVRQRELRAVGLAPPPDRYLLRNEHELIELDQPAWAVQGLEGQGRYQPREGVDLATEVTAEIARLEGLDGLRRRVEELQIAEGLTVERLLGLRAELKDDVIVFLSGARIAAPASVAADGAVSVKLELPLWRLWRIVRRGMEEVEVDPPTPQSTSAPATAPGSP